MDENKMKIKVSIEVDGTREEINANYKYLDQIREEMHSLFISDAKKELSMDYAEALSNKFKYVVQNLLERVLEKREKEQDNE